MEDSILQRFNGDRNSKETLLAFICETIDREALEKMYKGEDVKHIKDARELILKAFEDLETIYGIKTENKKEISAR